MAITRRLFTGSALAAAAPAPKLRIGVMDTTLRMAGKVEAVAAAARLGFDGIQISIGRQPVNGALPLADPELQQRYLAAVRQHKIPLASTYLDILHVNCLRDDPLAAKWVASGIDITRKLNAGILMLVFFGKCALTPEEAGAVIGPLKELAPEAAKAGVILGFENTLSARDNARVLDAVGSDALKVFYDVGNSTNVGGFDVPEEIRWLGARRICQFHWKDKGYLGEGKVDLPAVARATAEIGFRGFAVLETSAPSGSVEDDLRRNLSYARRVL